MPYESPSPGSRWIRSNWLDLSRYLFQWITCDGEGVIANGEDLDGVLADTLRQRALSDIAIAFVDGQEFEPGVGL